jgi:excisionase family DNA binding protein
MKNDSISEFLTVAELSIWIRLSRSHIYFLVSKKKIPFIKLGGHTANENLPKQVDTKNSRPII